VYAELKARRDDQATKQIAMAAFGDALYPDEAAPSTRMADAQIRDAAERGLTLSRLLFSGSEVESIASVFAGECHKYLRAEATEEHAKALSKDVRYIHFATHGFLDERLPLNSGLVLSIPPRLQIGRDNGLLQAWEVLEQLRIDADLVTLSGCNTALGQELAGEGLVGLVRAFQYAGAHSVLASLWSVDDRRTSLLMERFYRELRDGKTKDEALRAAQVGLLRSPHSTRPFYWAGFVLNGDWR
jgi:CHAT domain-containing protein